MADRNIKRIPAWLQALRVREILLFWVLLAVGANAQTPAPAVTPYRYEPRAHFVEVQQAFVHPGTARMPGAGVRAFQDPEAEGIGTERFEIRWYANPPGIPPGVVLLLETIAERSARIKNHVLRFNEKSEGHIRSVIEIPAAEIRQAGRIRKWRIRVVWHGRVLATQASANWDG